MDSPGCRHKALMGNAAVGQHLTWTFLWGSSSQGLLSSPQLLTFVIGRSPIPSLEPIQGLLKIFEGLFKILTTIVFKGSTLDAKLKCSCWSIILKVLQNLVCAFVGISACLIPSIQSSHVSHWALNNDLCFSKHASLTMSFFTSSWCYPGIALSSYLDRHLHTMYKRTAITRFPPVPDEGLTTRRRGQVVLIKTGILYPMWEAIMWPLRGVSHPLYKTQELATDLVSRCF